MPTESHMAGTTRFDADALKKALLPPTVFRSIAVAVVVGTILNLINQGAQIFTGKSVNIPKLVLTFVVPFFVATYGAYSAYRAKRGR